MKFLNVAPIWWLLVIFSIVMRCSCEYGILIAVFFVLTVKHAIIFDLLWAVWQVVALILVRHQMSERARLTREYIDKKDSHDI